MIVVENRSRFLYDPNDPMVFEVSRTSKSPLGNPYRLGRHVGRGQTIELYKDWLVGQISIGNQSVISKLREIEEASKREGGPVILLCHCYPNPCHANIVKQAVEEKWIYKCHRPSGHHVDAACSVCGRPCCAHCDDVGSGYLCGQCCDKFGGTEAPADAVAQKP